MVVARSLFRLGVYQPDGRVDPLGRDPDLGAGWSRLRRHHLVRVFACGRRFLRRHMRPACRPTSPMRAPPISIHDVLVGRSGQHAGASRRRIPAQHLVRRPQHFRYAGRRCEVRLGRSRHDDDQRDRRRSAACRVAGYLEWNGVIAAWTTWWLRDAAGVACRSRRSSCSGRVGDFRPFNLNKVLASATALAAAGVVGVIAFSPLIEQTAYQECTRVPCRRCRWCGRRCGADHATPRRRRSFFRVSPPGASWRAVVPSGRHFQQIVPAVRHVHDRRFDRRALP